ncbi:trypsin-like serine protease [Bdellovibrio bacteriovorus]
MISKNSLKALLATSLLTSLVACAPKSAPKSELGVSTSSASIIGGEKVLSTDQIAKSTVALIGMVKNTKDEVSQFICTGTLIAKNIILTAAHCIPQINEENVQAGMFAVFAQDLHKAKQTDVRHIIDVEIHEDWGKENESGLDTNDIALVKFDGAMPAGYQLGKFLADEKLLKDGATVTLAGYGLIKTDGVNTESDETLRKVDVEVLERIGNTEVLLDQNKGKGACHGDSGGPAFLKINGIEYVWGVTSRGFNEEGIDNCTGYSIYTEVAKHATFIKEGLAKLSN